MRRTKPRSLHRISELLNILEQTTGEPGDLTGTLRHIVLTAQKFFNADACAIYAINPITGRFVETLTVVDDAIKSEPLFRQPGEVTQQVLQDGMLVVEILEEGSAYQRPFAGVKGIQSLAGLALYMKHRQKALGVLYLGFKDARHFSLDDHDLFRLFADQISYILQETWLVRRYREVARIGHEINQELATIEVLFQKLTQHLPGILDISYTLLLAVYMSPTNTFDLYMFEEGESRLLKDRLPGGAIQYSVEKQQTFFSCRMSKEQLPFQRVFLPGSGERESEIFVPLTLRGVSLGALSIQHPDADAYNKEDRSILELLGNHIALALYDMRLYDSLLRLNEAGQFLTQQLDSEQVLQATVDKIWQATEADSVILYPYDPALQRFVLPPRVAGKLVDPTPLDALFLRPEDIVVRALNHAEPIYARQGAAIYALLRNGLKSVQQDNFQQREKVASAAIMPLRVGEVSVGVLFVNFRQEQRFATPQKLFIEGLAHYAALAIKNAQVFGALSQRRVRELEILQNIDRELSRPLDLENVLDTILKLGYAHVPAEEASILLYDAQSKALKTMAAIGRHAEISRTQIIYLHETKAITRWVVENRKPACVKNIHRDVQWRELHFPVAPDILSELDVPMLDGEEVVGVLNFESTNEAAFGVEEELFLFTLAGQAVLAIKKAQAYEREKYLAEESRVLKEEAQVLNEISKEIISQLDLAYVFNLILEKALDLTHAFKGSLMLYDANRNDLWMAAERGVAADKKRMRQQMDEGIVGYAAAHRQVCRVDDVSQSPWKERYIEISPDVCSELAVPMLAGDRLYGVLNVESPLPHNFSESSERLLRGLADLAVIALQNAEAYEREKHAAAENRILNEISQEIATRTDSTSIFQLILKKALESTGTDIGSLHLYDPVLGDLRMAAESGVVEEKRGHRQKPGEGIVGYAAERKQLCRVEDISRSPWKERYIEFSPGVHSEVAIPMLEGNEIRGVLNVESAEVNHFDEEDVRLLKCLADLAVVALQSTERYEKAGREAQHFQMLYQGGQELARITYWEENEEVYDIIQRIAEEHSPCQIVICLYGDNTQELAIARTSYPQSALPFMRIKLDEDLNGLVAQERQCKMIIDTRNLPEGVVLKWLRPATRSLLIVPIQFKDRYYGNIELGHSEAGYFRGSEISFFEGLADQLASTIYRLEKARERQELELISSLGESAFELTHRLANDLGLVEFYAADIQWQLRESGVKNELIIEKLGDIVRSVKKVLSLSDVLKREVAQDSDQERVLVFPRVLLEDAARAMPLPSNISIGVEIDEGVGPVQVVRSKIADILRNLISNAIDAMPAGGKIMLQAHNLGRSVAMEVIDTGVGIPQKQLAKIFDLSHSTKGSSGFGLWSALRKARLNRGELRVESQPGHTTFTLLLPRTDGGTV